MYSAFNNSVRLLSLLNGKLLIHSGLYKSLSHLGPYVLNELGKKLSLELGSTGTEGTTDNSYVTDEPTEEEPGRILRNCVVCRHALERKLYSDGTEADVHVMGDGNNDGEINIIDVTLAARYIAQRGVTGDFDLSECDIEMFDVNLDGTIDQLDLNGIAAIIRNN